MDSYRGKEFEALSLRYTDHVELLRKLTDIDHKWFTLSVTLQLLVGAWLFQNQENVDDIIMKVGILLIDVALMTIGIRLLYLNYVRRCEAVRTLKNVMEALGFTQEGVYLPDRAINPTKTEFLPQRLQTERILRDGFRPWFPHYKWGIIFSIIGFAFIIFGKELAEFIH